MEIETVNESNTRTTENTQQICPIQLQQSRDRMVNRSCELVPCLLDKLHLRIIYGRTGRSSKVELTRT